MGSSYRDLLVWQKAMELVNQVYSVTDDFPQNELFGLTSQIRRSAVSIPSNIAEGHGRNSNKEFLRFIYIALGSLAELDTQTEIATRQQMLTEAQATSIFQQITETRKMLYGLANSLKN